ncbi:MAG: AAA family ATPase [Candidatus Limiplasma sp.]|nr:AAA family ATPase [Candidatus Limiplasma sp.]
MITDVQLQEIKLALTSAEELITIMCNYIKLLKCHELEYGIVTSHETNSMEGFRNAIALESVLPEYLEKLKSLPEQNLDMTDVYQNFLFSAFVTYSWNGQAFLNDNYYKKVSELLTRDPFIIARNDTDLVNALKHVPHQIVNCGHDLGEKVTALIVFNKIHNIQGNIVMIGANGSGKSTFSRQLKGKLKNGNLSILSAQHLLFYEPLESIPAASDSIELVRRFQGEEKLSGKNDLAQSLLSDMNKLISALIAEHTDCALDLYDGCERKTSVLSKCISIWEALINHRSLSISRGKIEVISLDKNSYPFNSLSDGEKAVFYYTGHVMLASPSSYIVIDEPENHLHHSICDKLWNRLEAERADCSFIYLTHNLNFALSRTNATVLWNKSFLAPDQWDFEKIDLKGDIPAALQLELLGSRKNVIFCEGDGSNSIDYKLYSLLFTEFTVVPAGGHLDVIAYTKAYNSSGLFQQKAFGLIDGDCHSPEQVDAYQNRGVFTIQVNEVENLLCDMYILDIAVKQFCAQEGAKEDFIRRFWCEYKRQLEEQTLWYVYNTINNHFRENFLEEKHSVDRIKEELSQIASASFVDQLYMDRKALLVQIMESNDYDEAMKHVSFKRGLTVGITKATIVDKYTDRVLDLIKKNETLREHIRNKYFSEFIERSHPCPVQP